MALLTAPVPDAQRQTAYVADLIQLTAQLEQQRARDQQQKVQVEMQRQQQVSQDQRRAFEFDRRLEFDRAKTAADDRRADSRLQMERELFQSDNMPVMLSGAGPAVYPSSSTPAPTGSPSGAPPMSIPASTDTSNALPLPVLEDPSAEAPAEMIGPMPEMIGPTMPTPAPPLMTPSAPEDAGAPALPTGAGPAQAGSLLPGEAIDLPALEPQTKSPGQHIASLVKDLQKQGIPVTQKVLKQALPSMMSSAMSAEQRRATAAAAGGSDSKAKWPINQQGYRFNPDSPEQQFMERSTPKGTTYTQIKASDSGYGLQPVGEGLFEDLNGARFFVESISKQGPKYKRVEEDAKVTYRTKDAQGRLHSYNQFGAEVGVTPEWLDLATPKTKPMVGSDGEVYAFDSNKGEWINPPPAGVKFDGGKATEAKVFKVASDGKVYGFKYDGEPTKPIPEGIRFDKPKDESAAAEWRVDQTTGDLHVFNSKGDKIAVQQGDYARQSAGTSGDGSKPPTLSDAATYEAIAPTVKGLWNVMDQIRSAGMDAHASHQELTQTLGQRGAALSDARNAAQKATAALSLRGRKVGRDFAEGYVRAFEARQAVPSAQATTTPPAATPAAPAPPAAAETPDQFKASFEKAKSGDVLYYEGKPYKKP